jgi:cytoskeletal protein CcmA (bactofilin family)
VALKIGSSFRKDRNSQASAQPQAELGLEKIVWETEPEVKNQRFDSSPIYQKSQSTSDYNIGAGCSLSGMINLSGTGFVAGALKGDVFSTGIMTLESTGVVEGQISGEVVVIAGTLRGDVECSEKLLLKSGAILVGNISSPAIVIEDGVKFEGFCKMKTAVVEDRSYAEEDTISLEDEVVELEQVINEEN